MESNLDESKLNYLLSQISKDYKGYNLQSIITVEAALMLINKERLSFKAFLKCFLSFSFNNFNPKGNSFFVLGRHGRKDYKEIVEYVSDQLEGVETSFFDFDKVSFNVHFSLNNLLYFFKKAIVLKDIPFFDKILLASKLCFYRNNIDNLESLELPELNCKNVVLFSSIHPCEAMLVDFFSKRKIDTISLQHGVYFIYQKTSPIDLVLYKNFNANKHLCWGDYSLKEFCNYGIDKNKLIVAGYPRQAKSINIKRIENSKDVLVLLTRKVLGNSNFNLLNMLSEYSKVNRDYKFHLKLHPSLNEDDFKLYIDNKRFFYCDKKITVSELFQDSKFRFAICVYTTAYYEAYLNGIIGLRFDDGNSELSEGILNDIFSNENELKKAFNIQINNEEIFERLNYIIGSNENNYKKILCDFYY